MTIANESHSFEVIPSIDILDGEVVRLLKGDYARATRYGSAADVVARWNAPEGTRVHVVDLTGAKEGTFRLGGLVRELSSRYRVQVGGGLRSVDQAAAAIEAGADRVVIGTMAVVEPETLRALAGRVGGGRIVVALDLLNGAIRISGWTRSTSLSLEDALRQIENAGIREVLVTDISRDGAMSGPSFELYRRLSGLTSLRIIASGGVSRASDLTALARGGAVSGAIIGRALQEGVLPYEDAVSAVTAHQLPVRIVPCLDVRGGRVVKGTRFVDIRDAGDPVECVRRYEAEGADEIVMLDISATEEERATSMDTVKRIADQLFIPLTIGGGVRSVEGFRSLLRAGADRVAINTAAVTDPQLISRCAAEFGVQAVVLACDAKRAAERWEVVTRSGSTGTGLDAVGWCRRAAELGAGEILLTSIDGDGTADGYDNALLRAVTGAIDLPVIASGGAGRLEHFREAIETGGASAVLAASLFHDLKMTIGEVKRFLASSGIEVRR
ncbi:MAG TPA: imidazole glycerol phosphate synthase subunit HisF [Thermoanaerobaculia bacterium]|nr:imidazole glycerol phosphate synthase subunit HisF [Thermoanaerobaculia bacterium]